MSKTKTLQEIRDMRFEDIYKRRTEKRLTVKEAADILGVSERTFRRWGHRFEEGGLEGLADRRIERAAHNSADVSEVMEMIILFETIYPDFTVAHFYDKWVDEHQGQRCYTWVKNKLQEHGHVKKAKKRGAHRRKRPRQPMRGMMIHQDASTHEWVPGVQWDLIVTMDDATSEIYSAFFVDEEGTWSSFQGVQEVIEAEGLFCTFYSDRGSHYWYTPKAGGKVDKETHTQFGRAMKYLGIEMIAAYSPEARGRSERTFGTLQGRLPNELALKKISDMAAANKFLKEVYIPSYNLRFSVKSKEEESAFVPWLQGTVDLESILCIQEERTVNKDNTVSYKGKHLQIPKTKHRCHYVKVKVLIREYYDGTLAIYHGPRFLAKYEADGCLIEPVKQEVKQAA